MVHFGLTGQYYRENANGGFYYGVLDTETAQTGSFSVTSIYDSSTVYSYNEGIMPMTFGADDTEVYVASLQFK